MKMFLERDGSVLGRRARWLALAATTVLFSGTAAAQSPSDEGQGEIIVTAQKRSQTLLTVPASVQPLTADTLEKRELRNLEEFSRFVPSLTFSGTNGAGNRNIILRGIAPSGGGDPTVVTYLDDTLLPNSLDPQLYDIARVEILKGPQGDLYGASSAGGLIRYISAAPDYSQTVAKAESSLSFTEGGGTNYGAAAALNLPVSGAIAVRGSLVFDHRNGFIDNLYPVTGELQKNVNDDRRLTGRLALGLKPSDAIEITLSGVYNKRSVDGFSDSDRSIFLPGGGPGLRRTSRFNAEFNDDESWIVNGSVNADVGFGTLSSSSGYVHQKQHLQIDLNSLLFLDPELFGGFSYPGFDPRVNGPFATNPNTQLITPADRPRLTRQFTQEIRFASDWDFPVQILVGGYYLDGKYTERFTSGFTAPIPEYVAGLYGPGVDPNTLTEIGYTDRNKFKEKAVFGNLSWKFADERGELKLGMRHYDRKSSRVVTDAPGILFPQATAGEVKSEGELYSATGSFQVTPRLFVYARYSEGFRPGQSRAVPGALCDIDFNNLGIDRGSLSPFTDPENLKNIEGGVRFASSDRRFSASVTGFRIKYDGIQQGIVLPTCGNFFSINAGKATSQGFEMSLSATPTTGMTFAFDLGYTDARFDNANLIAGIDKGEHLQFVPKWTAALRGDYSFPVNDGLSGVVRGDLTFTDKRQTVFGGAGARPSLASELPSFAQVGLQAGVQTDNWELVATVTNLFDVTPIYNSTVERYSGQNFDGRTWSVGRPRTMGLRLSYNL